MRISKGALCVVLLFLAPSAALSQVPHCPPGYIAVGGRPIGRTDGPPVWVGARCVRQATAAAGFQAVGPVTILPDFYLVTILYAIPGERSEAKYGSGASVGSKTEDTSSFKLGFSAEIETNVSDVTAGYAFTAEDGHSFEVKKEDSTELLVDGVADPKNAVDHNNDTFFIWVNPRVEITQTGPQQLSQILGSSGSTVQIVAVTGRELKDPSLLPAWKQTALARLTDADRAQIVGTDPYLNGKGIFGDPRFVKIDTLQLDGPDNAGDPVTGQGLEVDGEQTASGISSGEHAVTLSAKFGGDVDTFVKFKAMAGPDFEWTTKETDESSNGTVQKYEVTLSTAVVGYHASVDIYEDTLFNSMVFVPTNQVLSAAELAGLLTDDTGRPIPNELITVALENGQIRRVFTNSRGIYRVFGIDRGRTWIGIRGAESETTIGVSGVKRFDIRQPKAKAPNH